jgi:hypothetical protein
LQPYVDAHGRTHGTPTDWIANEPQTHLDKIVPRTKPLATSKKILTNQDFAKAETPFKWKINFDQGAKLNQEIWMPCYRT